MAKLHPEETAKATRNHEVIRRWAEARGGRPARLKMFNRANGGTRGGILRIDFREGEINLEPIEWNDFFAVFDYHHFVFLYQDEFEGEPSKFFSIVKRGTQEDTSDDENIGTTFHTVEEAKEKANEEFEEGEEDILEEGGDEREGFSGDE